MRVRVLPPEHRRRPGFTLGSFRSAPSSRGLGHHPLKVATRVRIPLGLLARTTCSAGGSLHCGGGHDAGSNPNRDPTVSHSERHGATRRPSRRCLAWLSVEAGVQPMRLRLLRHRRSLHADTSVPPGIPGRFRWFTTEVLRDCCRSGLSVVPWGCGHSACLFSLLSGRSQRCLVLLLRPCGASRRAEWTSVSG